MSDIAGLLLMGGRSRRMGQDKAHLVWDGEVLWRRQHRLLTAFANPVLRAVPYDTPRKPGLLVDPAPYPGPVPAIVQALKTLAGEWLLVLAVDLPRVDEALLGELISRRRPRAVTVASAGETVQPLLSIWHRDVGSGLAPAAEWQGASVARLLARLPVFEYRLPPALWPRLANLNRPGDLDD